MTFPGCRPAVGDADPARYRLISHWHLAAPREQVWAVLEELLDGPDPFVWWEELEVLSRTEDEIRVRARSVLGYRLRFRLHSLRSAPPDELGFAADGDLEGRGHVRIAADDGTTRLRIDWHVDASRPWMRRTSWVLRPAFVLAHDVIMRRGQRHLNAWLARSGPVG